MHAASVADFQDNLTFVTDKIREAKARSPYGQSVRLLPISKTVPAERVRLAIEAGMTRLGENKIQEAHQKWQDLSDTAAEWAIVGHLQRNKARFVAEFATEFQALDSLDLAETLDRRLQMQGRSLEVFVQVNTSGEESKFGLHPDDVEAFLKQLPQFSALKVQGLMTLAVFSKDHGRVRRCFVTLRELRDRLRQSAPDEVSLDELSMGMSGDFELAIEEGATVVRVGQAIFGPRQQTDGHYWPGFAN